MANKSSSTSKSTTTKKSTATKKSAASKAEAPKVKAQVLATETTITVTESAPTPLTQVAEPEPVKRTYATNDMIPCKSVRYGMLQHVSRKSGDSYVWEDYGDVVDVSYGDLLALKSGKSKFLYAPWFLVLDDQLAEEWKLKELYTYFEEFEDVEEFLQSGAIALRRQLPNAPQGYKDLIVHKAGEMIRNGSLDSIGTVKAIDDVLNKSLSEMIGG